MICGPWAAVGCRLTARYISLAGALGTAVPSLSSCFDKTDKQAVHRLLPLCTGGHMSTVRRVHSLLLLAVLLLLLNCCSWSAWWLDTQLGHLR